MRLYNILLALCGRAIVEMGAKYVRFGNGLQICWGRIVGIEIPVGSTYTDATITFPAAFSVSGANIQIVATYSGNTTLNSNVALCDIRSSQITATKFFPRLFRQVGSTTQMEPAFDWIAIGRWK